MQYTPNLASIRSISAFQIEVQSESGTGFVIRNMLYKTYPHFWARPTMTKPTLPITCCILPFSCTRLIQKSQHSSCDGSTSAWGRSTALLPVSHLLHCRTREQCKAGHRLGVCQCQRACCHARHHLVEISTLLSTILHSLCCGGPSCGSCGTKRSPNKAAYASKSYGVAPYCRGYEDCVK